MKNELNRNSLRNKGFTLIELMVVISIIALLSSIILFSLNVARARANDTHTLAQTQEIQKGFMLASGNSALPSLPNPGDTSTFYCIGKTAAQNCTFWGLDTLAGNAAVNTALAASIPSSGITSSPVVIDGLAYNGIVYKCTQISSGSCSGGAVYWAQSGSSCTVGKTVVTGSGGVVCGQDAGSTDTKNVETGAPYNTASVLDFQVNGTYASVFVTDGEYYTYMTEPDTDPISVDPTDSYSFSGCPGTSCRLLLNCETYIGDGSGAIADPYYNAWALHDYCIDNIRPY